METTSTQAEQFKNYIDGLEHLKTSTKSNYRTYVNWIERCSVYDFDQVDDLSEERIHEIAQDFNHPGTIVNDGRRSDVRTVLRHYRKFRSRFTSIREKPNTSGRIDEERKRILASIAVRRGQPRFRKRLMLRYKGKCVITGTKFTEVLEAAHIVPYSDEGPDHLGNGLLLRSDVHVLFDLLEISIHPQTRSIRCSRVLRKDSDYAYLHGKILQNIPDDTLSALKLHFARSQRR